MKNTSKKGIIWLFFSKLFPPLINFLVFAYTVRILSPEDFGLVALALSIIYILASLMPSGWRSALVKYQCTDKLEISSVFWLNFFVSIFLAGILVVFAQLSLFGFQNEVFNLALTILTIKLIFDGLFHTLNIILLQQQKYSLIALRTIISSIISSTFIIILIMFDYGVWALIWAQVLLSISNFIAVLIPTRRYVFFSFCTNTVKKMNPFAVYTTFTDSLTTALDHYDSIIVGLGLGTRELGFYNVAQRLNRLIGDILIGTVNEVSFPELAKKQNKMDELKSTYLCTIYLSVACLYPFLTLFFIKSDEIFIFLFTDKWLASSIIFQAFCIMFAFILLGVCQKNIIILHEHAKWWFQLQLKLSIIIIPLTAMTAFYDLNALLISLIFAKFLYTLISMWKSCQILSLSLQYYVSSFLRPVCCCITTGILFTFIETHLLSFNNVFIGLVFSGVVFFVLYLVLLILIDFNKLINIGMKIFPSNPFLIKLSRSNS
ncbi:hypothetical protein E2R68_03425 [Psychromonas sp. RZ22]|uniref:oligosaccharide flippase family protein n=1 Tax=Psychromonas algarum TaxID=2555643 RepID=UPI001068064E|nr:oligosaccharide flippase family protein [Psychromonas sp. RZ22]TEW56157.1 hypothetical protein E2R68_03425 [Psychromonas sp. RZ22]